MTEQQQTELQTLLEQIKDCYNNEFTSAEQLACTSPLLGYYGVISIFLKYHNDIPVDIINTDLEAHEICTSFLDELCTEADYYMNNIETNTKTYKAAEEVTAKIFEENGLEYESPNSPELSAYTYNDFSFSMDNSHWILNIHDCADDDSVIIVDFNIKDSDADANQMILKSKFVLEALLVGFFGFNAEEVEEALKEIEESEAA